MPIHPETLASIATEYAKGMSSIRGRRIQRLVRREFAGADDVVLLTSEAGALAVLGLSPSGAALCASDGRGKEASVVRWRHGSAEALDTRYDLLKDSLPALGSSALPITTASADRARLRVTSGDVAPERQALLASAIDAAASSMARDSVRAAPAAAATEARPASALIDARIAELGDWRGETLRRVRAWIKEAAPSVVEEWKWMGTPVWSHAGILCTGESYKSVVKLTFLKGASLPDPAGLFNASLDGNARRAIDIREHDRIDGDAFKALIGAAVALNVDATKTRAAKKT